jgi:hypothetical protein
LLAVLLFFNSIVCQFYLDIDFNPLLKSTFSSAYWLQKNIAIECFTTSTKHVSIYTLPITNSRFSTTVDVIDKQISVKSPPSHLYIQNLIILSNSDYCSPKLSMMNLFTKFPYLTHLEIDTVLLLPRDISICSNHLRSLSLCNYSLPSCCQLLNYFPGVKSLSITSLQCTLLDIDSCSISMLSITRLKISIGSVDTNKLPNITKYFPNVNEFYLIIKNSPNRSNDDFRHYEKFDCFSKEFIHLRYIEITLPIKQDYFPLPHWMNIFDSSQTICKKTTDGNSLVLKTWI